MGKSVRAFGAGFDSTLSPNVLGVPAAELVDRIVPLKDLWSRLEIERLAAALMISDPRRHVTALRDEITKRTGGVAFRDSVSQSAGLLRLHAGCIPINDLAERNGLTRQQFRHRFLTAAGLPPKLYARITRFQKLVHSLLSADVSNWAGVASDVGFYDQAHMINEFHGFAGSPPTVFFQPRGSESISVKPRLCGRPYQWPGRT
ncbi:MAG: AraC family transcriptional regulator [Bryobacteraceae bacterium]|nr:AraC family transcriptional regulator [Bryobacteraceae bacterium]